MSIIDDYLIAPLARRLAERLERDRDDVEKSRAYRVGVQPPSLRVVAGGANDNTTINLCGLIADRIVSGLLGRGIEFDLPGDEETQESQYIDLVWSANKQPILLHKAALNASDAGTGYLMIVPGGLQLDDGTLLPRLVATDPALVEMESLPDDYETVIRYTITYQVTQDDVDMMTDAIYRRYIIEHVAPDIDEAGNQSGGNTWQTVYQVRDKSTAWNWQTVQVIPWPYTFPPIIHWQNLPAGNSVYGRPDITPDVQHVQDRYNFAASNIQKIIRLYAHPLRWARGISAQSVLQMGPDKLLSLDGPTAEIGQMEQLGDLSAAQSFAATLRKSMFDVTRTVDTDSMADKVGALTNFGLRVLYQDFLAMIGTKRELLGDALIEINHRLLVLAGFANTDGGDIIWPDPLPVNDAEVSASIANDLANKLVSRQTAAMRRGYDWEQEQERIDAEAAAADNIGAQLLRSFNQGL